MSSRYEKEDPSASLGEKPTAVEGDHAGTSLDGDMIELDEATNKRLLRKIDWRLMPVLCFTYALQYYDKAILSQAAIFGLRDDLNLNTGLKYSWVSLIFYFGYIVVSRSSWWYSFSGGSLLVSPLINYGLGHIKGGSLNSWQYMYIIAGIATLFWGAALWWVFPDSPQNAKGFTETERRLLLERVRGNNAGSENRQFKPYQFKEALFDYQLWGIIILSIVSCTGSGAVTTFGTIVFKDMGFDVFTSLLLNLPIGAMAFICVLGSGYIGQKVPNSRLYVVVGACAPVILGCALLWKLPDSALAGRIVGFYLISFFSSAWVQCIGLGTSNVAGHTKKAVYAAGTFIGYSLGNIVGPLMFDAKYAPRYDESFIGIMICFAICVGVSLALRLMLARENSSRDRQYGQPELSHGLEDMTDRENKSFSPPSIAITDDDQDYPEGGTRAWLVVVGAWCAMIPSMGLLNTLSVLQAWVLENELSHLPESTVGWIFGCYGFFLYFCGAQVGPIIDTHDIKLVIIPGSIGMVASMIFVSLSTEFYQFLLSFGVLGGISASLLFNPSLAAVGHWFYKRRAFATGLACTAGGIGGVAFPLVILYLGPKIGFPWAIRVIALINAVSGAVACCLLRKRLPPNKKAGASIDLKALSDLKYAATTMAIFLVEFAVFIPYSYISAYAIHHGFDPQKAYMLNTLLNVGAVPGRALPGYVADRFGTFNTMCITAFICAAFILTLWLTSDGGEVRTTSFTILFGFWSGAAISLTPVCVSQVCRIEDYGKRNGTAFFIASFGALTGIPIAGAILEANHGSYWGLIVFAGVLYAAAFAAFVFARGVAGGWNLRTIF
ncbi:hypothetical protein CEP52_002617 [Fusarium oligoseptatum]|uniref:Major facilitator superfamily (MFS) profile domain-containing protein n=1 Tax=Fusarium oligoseptatum TaxID=2604345 RepID=A0A428UCR9_9HYPO|nr:hypothetical protein CEP52_002617 [Fusarium oligoseptatum]